MKTGFIGLGAMGTAMARNVAKSGLLTAVYNRTADKAKKLAAEFNISECPSAEILSAQVDVILICVSADNDVLQIVTAMQASIKPGTIVVDMSTINTTTVRKAKSILAKKQAVFLDAPVSGGIEGAKTGNLVMMVGGEQKALESIIPILETMTVQITHMGDSGSGQATKAVNQIMAAGINQAVTEALAFGQAQDLAMDKVLEVISGGAAANWFLQHRGQTMINGIFAPGFRVALHHKDLQICQHMAHQCGVFSELTRMTLNDYEKLIMEGYGNEDISALYRLKRKPTVNFQKT